MNKLKAEWQRFLTWFFAHWLVFVNDKTAMSPGKGGAASSTQSKIGDWIGLTVSLIFGVYLLPVIIDSIMNTNYTNWTFTGSAGAKVLYQLLPFIFIVGMIVYFIGRLLGKI